MHAATRQARKYDRVVGRIDKDKTRDELLLELSHVLDHKQNYTVKVLKKIAEEKNIPTKKTIDKIEERWAGKPMGLFHECWLLGLIDPNVPQSRYTKMGMKKDKDADGNLTDEGKKYCLTYLRSQCSDFQNEKSAIE